MRSIFVTLISIGLVAAGSGLSAEVPGGARLKDIAALQGPAATSVVGYGLVVGLNKTGDRKQTIFSAQTLASMLERFGVAVSPNAMKVENIAAVVVTAEIGPYIQNGGRIDVVASSIGDARSLQGGTLLPTPLRGPDGAVIALAQGALSIGGFGAGGGGNSVAVNHLTVGRVPRGATVQAFHSASLAGMETVNLALYEPDFASASRVVEKLLEHGNYPGIATHDEAILGHVRKFVQRNGIGPERFEFQMLYGVRRDLQEQLVQSGCRMRVYIPFGTQWYPYLMRRLAERPANIAFILGNIVKESVPGL